MTEQITKTEKTKREKTLKELLNEERKAKQDINDKRAKIKDLLMSAVTNDIIDKCADMYNSEIKDLSKMIFADIDNYLIRQKSQKSEFPKMQNCGFGNEQI